MQQSDHCPFDHELLDVYQLAVRWLSRAKIHVDRIPRGFRKEADQLISASNSIVRNISEGVGRSGNARANHYQIARGSAGECASSQGDHDGELAALVRCWRANVAYAQQLRDGGPPCRGVVVVITDGEDTGSKRRPKDCQQLSKDLLASEQFILGFVGVGQEVNFRQVARNMGVPPGCIAVQKTATPSTLRQVFQMVSQIGPTVAGSHTLDVAKPHTCRSPWDLPAPQQLFCRE